MSINEREWDSLAGKMLRAAYDVVAEQFPEVVIGAVRPYRRLHLFLQLRAAAQEWLADYQREPARGATAGEAGVIEGGRKD